MDVGNRNQITLNNLEDGQDYFFTVTAYDDEEESGESVEVQYIPAIHNHRPTVEDMSFHVDGSSSFSGTLNGSDADENPLEFIIVCPPTQGTLELEDHFSGAFTYIPNPDATGSDTFLFTAGDGMQRSNLAAATAVIATPLASFPDDPSPESDDPNAEPDHSWTELEALAVVNDGGTEYFGEEGVVRRPDAY
jgi:hypothetical protein